ncbi:MAG: D-alanyl-D-alanine carboxypeptidase [Alphaproteobacteria bacterium]|nr:D-alanyl-D-alanine carboxypeptidase [Alphaproteobacteria bacterium]
MRKLVVFFALCLVPFAIYSSEYRAAIVADMDTGQVLFSHRAEDLNYPASLTKLMTLYLTFDALYNERIRLNDQIIVSRTAAAAPPVKLGLAAGAKISVEDAIKAVAVHSANDVARALAENLRGGREATFASMMTDVARQIGLTQTNFENASGLPDDDHLSSARDIALLAIAIHQHFPQYWHFFGIRSWTYGGRTFTNGNRLLASYPGANGMKTGFTNAARFCLVATAQRDGRNIVAVVLGSPNRDVRANVTRRLLDHGFGVNGANPEPRPITPAPPTTPVPAAARAATPTPAARPASGGTGVQFGAFGSRAAAETQAGHVRRITGLSPTIEQAGGLHRVRAHGLSESAANNACRKFRAQNFECFVFR